MPDLPPIFNKEPSRSNIQRLPHLPRFTGSLLLERGADQANHPHQPRSRGVATGASVESASVPGAAAQRVELCPTRCRTMCGIDTGCYCKCIASCQTGAWQVPLDSQRPG